ncbi:MAG: DUF4065 domain-containing protein [Clostridiaceae bacterium]|jgi:putative zinc finger/helix-turn-helix YgiT family protein|nr:DUF4065 domain-containing protein [Clostridiaceae bacterium]
MEILKSEKKLCHNCMQVHDVKIVRQEESEWFKGEEVSFPSVFEYCSNVDGFIETEEMIRTNNLAMKDAYRKKVGLLTSDEIISIRKQYGISQKGFSELLNWGRTTITRYENHQVQDSAHDAILRKLAKDPKWFIEILEKEKHKLEEKTYLKYLEKARKVYSKMGNQYLTASIEAYYARFQDQEIKGCVELDTEKVVEMINYSASRIRYLHKVKLMKLLWYSDMLHYKTHGKSISGLVYSALPMGPVPEKHDCLIELEGVHCNQDSNNGKMRYSFRAAPGFKPAILQSSEMEIMDRVIARLRSMPTNELINRSHGESAYIKAKASSPISFGEAENLSMDFPVP